MSAPKKILVGSDFSEYSDRALKDALEMAETYKAKVVLLHVVDENLQQCVADYCLSTEVFNELKTKSESTSLEKLKEETAKISSLGNGIAFKVRSGIPYAEILKEQQEDGADLIILGSHGKRGFVENMLGGVAEKVLKNLAIRIEAAQKIASAIVG